MTAPTHARPSSGEPGPVASLVTGPATSACTCGGTIVAIEGEEALGVRAHQATLLHRTWRERGGMEAVVHGRLTPAQPALPAAGVSPERPYDPAEAQRGLAAALASQVLAAPAPADWSYTNGRDASSLVPTLRRTR